MSDGIACLIHSLSSILSRYYDLFLYGLQRIKVTRVCLWKKKAVKVTCSILHNVENVTKGWWLSVF